MVCKRSLILSLADISHGCDGGDGCLHSPSFFVLHPSMVLLLGRGWGLRSTFSITMVPSLPSRRIDGGRDLSSRWFQDLRFVSHRLLDRSFFVRLKRPSMERKGPLPRTITIGIGSFGIFLAPSYPHDRVGWIPSLSVVVVGGKGGWGLSSPRHIHRSSVSHVAHKTHPRKHKTSSKEIV